MRNNRILSLTRGIVVTKLLSKWSHSTLGGGLPLATQSTWLSIVFVNSTWCGGSTINTGPWMSNEFANEIRSAKEKKKWKSNQSLEKKIEKK